MAISRMIHRLRPRNSFLRGASVLAGSTLVAQVITLALSPLLTRLYSPSDFGLQAVVTSVITVVGVLASLRYETAIPLPEAGNKAANLMALALLLVAATTIITIAGASFGGPRLAQWSGMPIPPEFLWVLPASILTIGLFQVFSSWAIRQQAYNTLASSRLIQAVAGSGTQLVAGLAHAGALGLVLGQLANQVVGVCQLAVAAWRRDGLKGMAVSLEGMREVAWQYRQFPLFSTGAIALNTLSVQVPIFLLSFYFGPAVTGFYALGYRLLQVPVNLIGQSVSQVYLSRASQAIREGRIAQESHQILHVLIRIGVPLMLIVGIAAPELFSVLFGEKWLVAGEYVQWLSPWLLLVFVASPLSSISVVRQRQSVDLVMQAILLLARVATICVGGLIGSPRLAIAMFSLVSAGIWLGFLFWIIRQTNNHILPLLRFLIREIIITLTLSAPLVVAKGIAFYRGHDLAVGVSICAVLSALVLSIRQVRHFTQFKDSTP